MKFKENWVEFLKKSGVAIHCDTKEKARALLEELDKCGVHWRRTVGIGLSKWDEHKKDTCYSIERGYLEYSPQEFYMNSGYRVIEFEELKEMDYNIFTKSELIEAIKYSGSSINSYLLGIWDRKIKKLLDEIDEVNKKSVAALANGDYILFQEFEQKSRKLDKKYEKLIKALN